MAAPQNVQYNETTGILSWDSTGAGAVYEIGINQTEEGPWQVIGTTTLTTFSLANAPYEDGYAVVRDKKQTPDDPWSQPPKKWKRPPWL